MKQTHLPLPRTRSPDDPRRRHVTPGSEGNRGLYWNKFFNHWKGDFSDATDPWRDATSKIDYHGGKMNWVLSQVHGEHLENRQFETSKSACRDIGKRGAAHALEAAAVRIANLAEACGGEARPFLIAGPFVTGMGLSHPVENGFLFHHTLGVPYLPGSSVKGMMRAWACDWLQEDGDLETEIARLFGADPGGDPAAGAIVVFDAMPAGAVELYAEIITPHDGGWRISPDPAANPPADWVSPVPIPFLAVKEGAAFQFALAPRSRKTTRDDLDAAWTYLEAALKWIGAGAKTAVGFGRFEVDTSWKEGDQAVLELAGGIPVTIKTISAEEIRVTNNTDPSKTYSVRQFEKLRRP